MQFSFNEKLSPIEALAFTRRLERFMSLLAFDLVRTERTAFTISETEKSGETSDIVCPVEFAKDVSATKTNIDFHKLPLRLNNLDFGSAFDQFLEMFDALEQTLNWYRTVIAEDRYLEDKFFYCVRMIEALYKAIPIPTRPDEEAASKISSIMTKLSTEKDNDALVAFLKERVAPIFGKRWSLPEIVRDLKSRYSDVATINFLDARTINKLRAKQAHGSTQRLSAAELRYMSYSYRLLSMLYCLIILEHCGLDRERMLDGLKSRSRFERYFSSDTLSELNKACAIS